MKSTLLIISFFILPNQYINAARYAPASDTISIKVDERYAADTLSRNGQADLNPAASMSLVISSLSIFAMIFTFSLLSVTLCFIAGVLAISGLIFGIIGIRKRSALLKGKYASVREKRKLPLGQGRSIIGVIFSSVVTFVFGVLLVAIIAYGGY